MKLRSSRRWCETVFVVRGEVDHGVNASRLLSIRVNEAVWFSAGEMEYGDIKGMASCGSV